METLAEIANDLVVFDSDDEQYAEVLPTEEAVTLASELDELGKEGFATAALPAFISYSGRCGFASAGSLAFVSNRRRDRPVDATVRVRWRQGINSGSYDRVKTIPAGGRVQLGCTRGGGVSGGSYSYFVIGAQVL